MFFDFRHGPSQWPEGVELLDPKQAAELLEKAKKDAEAELKAQQEREALKDKGQDQGKQGAAAANQKKKSAMRQSGLAGEFVLEGYMPAGASAGWGSIESWLGSQPQHEEKEPEEPTVKDTRAPEDAVFDTLNDGSTALIVPPGRRLKLDLSALLLGGDAKKEQREKEMRKRKKRRSKFLGAWSTFGSAVNGTDSRNLRGFGGSDSPPAAGAGVEKGAVLPSSWKEWVNEYTVTMDIKIQEPNREGLSLFQTALVHVGDSKGQSNARARIKQSDGEALISPAGGVGVLGYFGDAKASVKADRWQRVAVSVKCSADIKSKGEMLTFVDAVPGAVVKAEAISANGRFAIDPAAFFVFSSSQSAMMSRTIAVRTIRVETKTSDEKDAKAGLARDRVLSMFNLEREREIDAQRKGLSLASLFGGKPRPMWSAPALIATFGDPFIEGTIFEGSSCLSWSFEVIQLIFQRMIADQTSLFQAPAALPTRVALGDVAHILAKSAPVFKDMTRLLKTPNNSQLMSFLRKLHNHISALPEGESMLLPTMIEGQEILLLLERNTERTYSLVVINTDPKTLTHHAVSPAVKHSKLMYRTCMVLPGIPKKNVMDDVFWMGVYNLILSERDGDMDRFYSILLPFLTGKPLEVSLLESELSATASEEHAIASSGPSAASEMPASSAFNRNPSAFGPWRAPQRAQTQYVRCLYQAVHFILSRRRGVSALRCKQVGLALRLQMVEMIKNDLDYMHPDDNGVKVCQMAFRQLSYRAVKLADALEIEEVESAGCGMGKRRIDPCSICLEDMQGEDDTQVVSLACSHTFHRRCLDELVNSGSRTCPLCRTDLDGAGSVEEMVDKVRNLVQDCESELLHTLDEQQPLPAALDLEQREACWVGNALAYDVEAADADPGQVVPLQKFVPMDLLAVPERISTRSQAVCALRVCDRLCTLLDNQHHNVKNTKHLILSLLEHVFIKVVPVPKPRKDPRADDAEASHVAERSQRRRQKEDAKKREIAAKRDEMRQAKGKKTPKKSSEDAAEAIAAERAEEQAWRSLEKVETSQGLEKETMICSQSCIWDAEITYELQVEMMLVLQRLMEHFASAVLSMQASRPLDALRVVVPGCICALSDAIIRRRAIDNPSVACSLLMGLDVNGRQLGVQGFGIGVGLFASQTETIEVHTPELVVARAAILDYFDSPLQRKLEKVFHWEESYELLPGRNLVKYLRMIAREIAMSHANPHVWLCDDVPESSKIFKNFPELRSYRDVVFYWKYFLNPDLKAFPNFSDAHEHSRMHTILSFHWNEEDSGYRVENSIQRLYCRPNPKEINPKTRRPYKTEELPKHRYPSTATPSFYAAPPPIKTEDDTIYRANLPSFEIASSAKKGSAPDGPTHLMTAALGQRDSELLLSFLTVPYLRLPLVLNFFATEDRVHKLALPKMRDILDSVLFEPGKHLSMSMTGVEPTMVPTQHSELLATVYGALLNELFRSPSSICRSMISIMDSALALDTGSVCDAKSSDFNSSVEIILYVMRLGARFHNYLHFTKMQFDKSDRLTLRDEPPDQEETIEIALQQVGQRLRGPYVELLDDYLMRLDEETTATPEDEVLVNRNSRLASDLNAHKLLCFRNCGAGGVDPLNQHSSKALVSSFIYLTTRHTWNKSRRETGKLLVPEFELYELFCKQRASLVNYIENLGQAELDAIMEATLQMATSNAGAPCKLMDALNRWGKLKGSRAAGRFVLLGSRAGPDSSSENTKPTDAVDAPMVVEDSGLQGVEMDLQLGQMTLRAKHLAALESEVANKPQVRELFGESTMQASLLERSEHRKQFKLIGLRHCIDYWFDGHSSCPALTDRFDRDYDPADLHDSEMWIVPLFEPVRKAFFSGPQPPAMQFMMAAGPLLESAEVAVLAGLHQHLGGIFKMVYIFRSFRCVQVFECVSHARQYWFVQHLSTDCRFSLRHLQPETRSLVSPLPAWWSNGGGDAYPRGIQPKLCSNLDMDVFGESYSSCAIIRDTHHDLNLSGSRETLVPKCLLLGLIPEAMLDSHRFWQDETTVPSDVNYRRMRGYPLDSADYLLIVEICNEISGPNAVTGLPERTVRIERRNYDEAKHQFKLVQAIAAKIQHLDLARAPPAALLPPQKVAKVKTQRFAVDDLVETLASDLISGLDDTTWVPCKIIADNNNGTFDVQHTNEWAWLGVVKSVPSIHIQPRTQEKEGGKGVWRFDGLSDSEDEAFRLDGSDDDEAQNHAEKQEPLQSKVYVLSHYQFSQVDLILKAARWDGPACEDALETIRRVDAQTAYYDMKELSGAVRRILKARTSASTSEEQVRPEDRMLFVDLLCVPRRSRLFPLVQALTRIETLSHICAWTRNMECNSGSDLILDLVELPRLKLSFAMRRDFEGKFRLFSLDHADLFLSNDFGTVSDLVRGIPHSVLLKNAARGEDQLLVPVLPPIRPRILTQPFSTALVIDRCNESWMQALSQRFFLYPIHISSSFIVTKGLNSALYLLLLRLLQRDYQRAFLMADSIATDAKFSEEGEKIFHALAFGNDDPHPDASAVRLKVTLVTMGCGEAMPWDLTMELASYIQKSSHVSATCQISFEEELQLLSSSEVVIDESSPKFKPDTHEPYMLALVKNRLFYLKARASSIRPGSGRENSGTMTAWTASGVDVMEAVEAQCFAPPRAITDGWPYRVDNSIFGEEYSQAIEIQNVSHFHAFVDGGDMEKLAPSYLRKEVAPPGGWLSVILVHVLWSSQSIKLMPKYAELVPMYPFVTFLTIKGDMRGLDKIVKELKVEQFPTILIMRGGQELEGTRITGGPGQDRVLERLMRTLGEHVTDHDRSAHVHLLARVREEAGVESDVEEEVDEDEELLWVFDVECSGPGMRVSEQGLCAEHVEDDVQITEPPTWEYRNDEEEDDGWGEWLQMPQDLSSELEKQYRRGHFYRNNELYLNGWRYAKGVDLEWSQRKLKLHNNMLTGICGNWDDTYQAFQLRRRGERVHVKDEEKFMTPEQAQFDSQQKAMENHRKAMIQYRRQEQRGKNAEAIRGTSAFHPNSGVHTWTLRWEHEPELRGAGDGIGLASSHSEAGGPCKPPLIGGQYDDGSSVALYANGSLYHAGRILDTAQRKSPRVASTGFLSEKKRELKVQEDSGRDDVKLEGAVESDRASAMEGKEEKVSETGDEYPSDDANGNEDEDAEETTKAKKLKEVNDTEIQSSADDTIGNLAQLWGKGSLLTCIFDTEGAGRLAFEVDGERLDLEVANVFSLLGADEVYPCVCLFPLDPLDAGTKGKVTEEGEQSEETAEKTDSNEESEEGSDEEESDEDEETEESSYDEDETEEEEEEEEATSGEEEEEEEEMVVEKPKSKKQKDLEELAMASNLSIEVLMSMSRNEVEELRKSVQQALARSRRARVTIVAPRAPEVEHATVDDSCAKEAKTLKGQEEAEAQTNNDDSADEASDEEHQNDKTKKIAADEGAQPLEKIRWMWEQASGLWEVYSPEISREIESARRAGESEVTIRLAETTVQCKISGGHTETVQERGEETQRLRRHVMKDGIFGMLEMQSVLYKPPLSLYGESCLTTLQKVWGGDETLSGRACGLGFLFIYSLLQGQTRSKVLTSGFSDWWLGDSMFGFGGFGGGSKLASTNDSHRLGLLLTQLLVDTKTKSVFASVLNVMGRNKQLSVRFPEFRDTRKYRSSNVYNAWTDDREPNSAIADLFNKLVPLVQGMRKSKHGSLQMPPTILGTEMPAPPSTVKVVDTALVQMTNFRAELSDLDCKERSIHPVSEQEIRALAMATKRTDWRTSSAVRHSERLPINIDDELHLEDVVKHNKDSLLVFIFYAQWCGLCRSIYPLIRKLALRNPTARFLRIDVENIYRLSSRLEIKTLPTIKILRPHGQTPVTKGHVLGTIKEIDSNFSQELMALIASASTPEEIARMNETSETGIEDQLSGLCRSLAVKSSDLLTLSSRPLVSLMSYIEDRSLKTETRIPTLDVSRHASAQSAVAQSMLQRMKSDVVAHLADQTPTPKLACVSDEVLEAVFAGADDASSRRCATQKCIEQVEELLRKLQEMRTQDTDTVQGISLLASTVVNYIDLAGGGFAGRLQRSKFFLRRAAGQASEVWLEFLFASILSSRGTQDLQHLNPYASHAHIETVVQLIMVGMLKANRVGHLSRCIGATLVLLKLLREAVHTTPGPSALAKFMQASDDVANIISAGRHFVVQDGACGTAVGVRLDPRFLIFEFTWNLLLRKKQVDIVNDFVAQVKSGNSKVKQMIMGEGKTTVVAPLLALILADSRSLLLSVVPKALLEMSRTQMRETFANIITKRISTFKFERSTVVHEGMRLTLENSVRNRGIVVATPTSIKSVMLVYIETLRNLNECWSQQTTSKNSRVRPVDRERVEQLSKQATELQGILRLFRQGVMLLDEVDLILHPLKSELNFPLGEKMDLDCSEAGERWSLPIHLIDGIFYAESRKCSVFEARGIALDVLNRIAAILAEGYSTRALQRLPHITLLNSEWYHQHLKPVLAEWVYLWLQKQHLHGVSRREAISYIVEGAEAGSSGQLHAKVTCLESAIARVESELGLRPPLTPPALTSAHLASLTSCHREQYLQDNVQVQEHVTQVLEADPSRKKLLETELAELRASSSRAMEQRDLVLKLYKLDQQQEKSVQASTLRLSELQQQIVLLSQEIQEVSCPRDDSCDNRSVIWCSSIFRQQSSSQQHYSGDDAVVLSACAKLEEAGFTIRKCGSREEAAELAWSLRHSGHLRCVLAGGASAQGCKEDCTRSHHNDGNCLVCGQSWGCHSGHTCPDGRLGSWLISKSLSMEDSSVDYFDFLKRLMQDAAPDTEPLPATRLLLFAGATGATMKEEKRLELWKRGVIVAEDKSQLLEWVEGLPSSWEADAPETPLSGYSPLFEPKSPLKSPLRVRREDSTGIGTLHALRERLQELEKMKESVAAEGDAELEGLRRELLYVNEQLEKSIADTVDFLHSITSAVVDSAQVDPESLTGAQNLGPTNGRDAAIAIAWLKLNVLDDCAVRVSDTTKQSEYAAKIRNALKAVKREVRWLSQAALAAKVMAHVTSPTQKKLLNLCYDWLRTFLPHILAKVNRVSFGLLSSKDCSAALEVDAMVPQSRLKLAVPFVGKDVPSRSSEFAHPDVILGLTILAYRYSGMRYEDFADLIDAMSAEFSQEIGPARQRPSSKRHEAWVLSAGGRIRGITGNAKTKKSASTVSLDNFQDAGLRNQGSCSSLKSLVSIDSARASVEGSSQKIEVVQLKFLQKSNAEQMKKLWHLWKTEPLAIHYYLSKFVFPAHMRSQKIKVSASGQALGGDMLVGRRLGFSGTPSDLLPKELGKCDYEKGDDGKMLKTVLEEQIVSHELLPNDWSVETVLARIAGADSPRYHALIDTGALITGYSNEEVARFLLKRGLPWCDGVVFLDENDEKQVLVRATGRAVPADQCGVPLERRFAFYDQIHTTGMDIKHVVNATAVITLGKDMTFRDYVQGAYRMRGIGSGQKIHVYVIPEVADLIIREIRAANNSSSNVITHLFQEATRRHAGSQAGDDNDKNQVLEAMVAWLVINSMRTEQTQWSMLCVQNVSNIYQKNAFASILAGAESFCSGEVKAGDGVVSTPSSQSLPLLPSLRVFDEAIDFSLEAAVPDPIPFGDKLRDMLTSHHEFIVSEEQHEMGHILLSEVIEFTSASEFVSENESLSLETQQEREMEQEQEKEIKARRDQQVEVEKFVEREYSRHQERPSPWSVSWLACQPGHTPEGQKAAEGNDPHPFFGLQRFHLLHQVPLPFPSTLHLSRNYFNPAWSGLRRLKNVVCLLEWCPSTDPSVLRLRSDAEHKAERSLTEAQDATIHKVHMLLKSENGRLTREGLREAVAAATNAPVDLELLERLWQNFGSKGEGVTAQGLKDILVSGLLSPSHQGRHWVAVSLAEAETLRRMLHLRQHRQLLAGPPLASGGGCEIALHISQGGGVGMAGSTILDASCGWRKSTGSTDYELSVSFGCFRFFDGDMHYTRATLAKLIQALQRASCHDREEFFSSTIASRRRLERKWQETPLASLFSIADEWVNLKQNAQAAFVRTALKRRGLTPWEAFVAFDADNNSRLSPSELYGALRWLEVPELTAEDVVDFFELADANRDGMIEYSEYMSLFEEDGKPKPITHGESAYEDVEDDGDEEDDGPAKGGSNQAALRVREPPPKIEPFGADELRAIMVGRRKMEMERQREELARRTAQQADLDIKLYQEELQASAARKGGSNPRIYLAPKDEAILRQYSAETQRLVAFSFSANLFPLRTSVSGKSRFLPVLIDEVRKNLQALKCKNGHLLTSGRTRWGRCGLCDRGYAESKSYCFKKYCYFFVCSRCDKAHEDEQIRSRSDPAGKHTFLQCEGSSEITIHVPPPSVDVSPDDGAVHGGGEDQQREETRDFAVTIELKLKSLPTRGQFAALMRFNSPDASQARRRHMASLYYDSEGNVGHGLTAREPPALKWPIPGPQEGTEAQETGQKEQQATPMRLREGRWMVLTASVQVAAGRLTVYMDGQVLSVEENLDPHHLALGSKFILLGGGKAAQSRGGSVRRVLLHDSCLSAEQALSTYVACAQEHPAIGGKLVQIQAVWRGRRSRRINSHVLEALVKAKEQASSKKGR